MEHTNHSTEIVPFELDEQPVSNGASFIESNTQEVSFQQMRNDHIIPVFIRNNEPLISHLEFIESVEEVVNDVYRGEAIFRPNIRVSHPVKGRIPEARHKPANLLEPWETTLYYERMMFTIEVATINSSIAGNELTLTVGGVKAYNHDNLHGRTASEQHFKLFAGFQNKVCTNMCVWSDGFVGDLKVRNISQLQHAIRQLVESFNPYLGYVQLSQLPEYTLTENQFAEVIGKCRMYQHLPAERRQWIPSLQFGDQQVGAVVREYYKDPHFSRHENGEITLWRLYNLFTGANKSSYIDSFLPRSVNALEVVQEIKGGLQGKSSWYLNR